jgi:putative Mn2+ efflux pump MntP
VGDLLGNFLTSRSQRVLLGVTLLLGVVGAVGALAGAESAGSTFVLVAKSVQILMSVTLPFIGVLMARDALRSALAGAKPGPGEADRARLGPMWAAATALAVAVGAFGVVVSAVALLVDPGPDTWDRAAIVALCGLLVQVVAQSVGTGFGLLLRPVVVACAATVVVPLGLWFLLGAAPALHPIQAWTTPYAVVQDLLPGRATPLAWARWFVVLLLWGVGLNVAGAMRARRRGQPAP